MKLIELFDKLVDKVIRDERWYSEPGTISNVDESARTCTFSPLDGSSDRYNVRFQATKDNANGFAIIPKEGTKGIMTFINKNNGFISACDEVEKIFVQADTLIQFNDGSNDGLVKVNDLVTQLNNIENDVNNLKTAFSAWIVVPSDGGAALKAATAAWYAASLTPTVKGDIENTNITQ